MSLNPVSEEALRSALSSFRVEPALFESGVRDRLEVASRQSLVAPLSRLSPFLKSVVALLPLGFLTGCNVAPVPAPSKPTPAAIGSKLLSYLAFPAISLFALFAAALFSVLKIRNLQSRNGNELSDQSGIAESLQQWNADHKWAIGGVFAVSLCLGFLGSSELFFWFYIVSYAILLYVITALAKVGLGSGFHVGPICVLGLGFLGQTSGFCGIGAQEIHFLDQSLVTVVFFAGAVSVLAVTICLSSHRAGHPLGKVEAMGSGIVFTIIVLRLMAGSLSPTLWPPTPARIKHYVESFDHAPFSTASWGQWAAPAEWMVESKLKPDLTKPRQLLAAEIAGEQNFYILGIAARVGLLSIEQIGQLKNYSYQRKVLAEDPPGDRKPFPFYGIESEEWVIRAAALLNDLSPHQRDVLEQRLQATLELLPTREHVTLKDLLLTTQLLKVIGRPVAPDRYREAVHQLLRRFHSQESGGFTLAGGFKKYLSWPYASPQPGAVEPTADAVQLMEIYGVPDGIDLNWVRSFLKPTTYSVLSNEQWTAAVTLERLNRLPGVHPPSWYDYLYYERTLLAALVMVGLCLYATILSPTLKMAEAEGEPPQPSDATPLV